MQALTKATGKFPVTETIDRMVAIIDELDWHLFARIDDAEQVRKTDCRSGRPS